MSTVNKYSFFLLLPVLVIPFHSTCSSDANDDVPRASQGAERMLEYYATQGIITDPGKYAYLYDGISPEVPRMVEAVQGVVIGYDHVMAVTAGASENRSAKSGDKLKIIIESENN